MKITIDKNGFKEAFKNYGRLDNFSSSGLDTLYDYLMSIEDDQGTDYELDVIALCCDFTEYEDLSEFQADYDVESYPDIESIERETSVVRIDTESFIVQNF